MRVCSCLIGPFSSCEDMNSKNEMKELRDINGTAKGMLPAAL